MSNFTKLMQQAAAAGGESGWDISTASYVQNFSVSSEALNPRSLWFKSDGTQMYIIGSSSDSIHAYNLSTAWDISTASYSTSLYIGGEEATPAGLAFSPDGTKMYIIGTSGDDVNEYNLSTAWDVSTASYVQNFSVSIREAAPTDLFFKPDGTKMYVTGTIDEYVNEYNLSTAWDISTASYLQRFSVASKEAETMGLFFKEDGKKMYICGELSEDVHEYDLSTAWDVSTASFFQTFDPGAQVSRPHALFFSPDGKKMYILDNSNDDVNEYDLL